ncbi:hypothetical protein CPT_Machias_058 [Staphylococcus phage Machias]|nr:hypothetical protein CPT_Machias_058 [Staphylococcus phage Machias]
MFNFERFSRKLVENGAMEQDQIDDISSRVETRDSNSINVKSGFKENLNNYIKGIVKFTNPKTGELIHQEENLVLMRTRVWILEKLFGQGIPSNYNGDETEGRTICLFSVGSGGADVNNSAFTPYTVKFSDQKLNRPVPFVVENPDKENSDLTANNPSMIEELSEQQKKKYYLSEDKQDGTTSFYGKRFTNATKDKPLGESKGFIIDNEDGSVAFSLKMSVEPDECRGSIINELGLWLAKYNEDTNKFDGTELATRLTFDSRSLKNLSDGLDIEYIIYI